MSRYKLSNQIFELGLNAQEISVYAYLCSLPTSQYTLDGKATIRVKQSTIAENCGLRAVQTVARILSRLIDKGLVERLGRSVKANHHKGTYNYAVKVLPTEERYFFVDRHVFGRLIPRQMLIYLFICKSYSMKLGTCWNSYNDIAAQTGMKREMVIQTIHELVGLHLITRSRRKAKENKRVFVDNHYTVIFFVRGTIRKKIKVRLHVQYNRTNRLPHPNGKPIEQFKCNTLSRNCQEVLPFFLLCRGSPSD